MEGLHDEYRWFAWFLSFYLDVIPAGGDSPFGPLWVPLSEGIQSYTLQAHGQPAREHAPSGLTISGVSAYTDAWGDYHLQGLITNNSSEPYKFVKVCGALYDSAGRVIRTGLTFGTPHVLYPGESASFDYWEPFYDWEPVDPTSVASYRLWVDAERY